MRNLLAPLGLAYGKIIQARECLYAREILKQNRLSKPVISVGNLTVGGTGKTPIVGKLLEQFERENLKACVLTRGYGRSDSSQNIIVNKDSTSEVAGDEPLWLARRHPKSVIAVGQNRMLSSKLAGDVDVYILDDGFQHLKIHRDLDIVLLDCTSPVSNYHPLPWGLGREKFSAVGRADIVILTRTNQVAPEIVRQWHDEISSFGVKKIIHSKIEVLNGLDIDSQKSIDLNGKKVFLVSGIGNPTSFKKTALELNVKILGEEILGDHFKYTTEIIRKIESRAEAVGAETILTTEKDGVKWREINTRPSKMPVVELQTTLSFEPELTGIYELAINRFR